MSDNNTEEINHLIKAMLCLKLYAALSKTEKSAEEIKPYIIEHLEYMIQLEKEGILFASGPFVEPNVLVGSGLTILRATDLNQAKLYMDNEPLVKRKLRSYTIFEWELREGRVNITVDFATGRYQFI